MFLAGYLRFLGIGLELNPPHNVELVGGNRGFTLVELVLILVLVGILSLFVMPRFFDQTTFDTRSFADDAQSMVRYAQKVAIAQNRNVFVVFTTNSGALCFDAACSSHVHAPVARKATTTCNDAMWMCVDLPANINVGVAPVQVFYFNALGRPFNQNDTDPTSSFAGLTISISGGGVNRAIVVERETGYVHS